MNIYQQEENRANKLYGPFKNYFEALGAIEKKLAYLKSIDGFSVRNNKTVMPYVCFLQISIIAKRAMETVRQMTQEEYEEHLENTYPNG